MIFQIPTKDESRPLNDICIFLGEGDLIVSNIVLKDSMFGIHEKSYPGIMYSQMLPSAEKKTPGDKLDSYVEDSRELPRIVLTFSNPKDIDLLIGRLKEIKRRMKK